MSKHPAVNTPHPGQSTHPRHSGACRNPVTEYLNIWTTAQVQKTTGRGKSTNNQNIYGIKKLRELILELAVQGQLVPQNSDDEPATILLQKISEEKTHLVKSGKIKKQRSLPEISEDEKPTKLPKTWVVERLGVFGIVGTGATPARDKQAYYSPPEINWVTSGETSSYFITGTKEKISKLAVNETNVSVYPVGTLIIAMYGQGKTRGQVAELMIEAGTNQACAAVILVNDSEVHRKYVKLFFEKAYEELRSHAAGGAQPNLNVGKISKTVIPIPPLAEQQRIVAKVDELMALCDQLEQQQTNSNATHQTLVETLLATLTHPTTGADGTETNAIEIFFQHFDTLFTTEQSIDQLKQTILQLAVMGKLVPQDPDDEPASTLLQNIAKEKVQLFATGKIKKQKPLPKISEAEKTFELPEGWKYVSLSHLGIFSGGKTPSKAKSDYWEGDIPWVTPKDMKSDNIYDSIDHITQKAVNDGLTPIVPSSLLFVVRSGILRRRFPVAITQIECTVNQDLKALSLYEKSIASYVRLMMQGFEQYILEKLTKTGTTVESVKFNEFSHHYFLFPPLAEQHRIIAKVGELLVFCDALKAHLNDTKTIQFQLADVIVDQVLA